MRRRAAGAALLGLLALAGCGIRKSDVVEAGGAATVVIHPIPEERMVLFFLGPEGLPMPVVREVGPREPQPTPTPGGPGDTLVPYDGFGPGYEVAADALTVRGLPTDKVLAALLAGPRPDEAGVGITTALPRSARAPHVEAVGTGRKGTVVEGRVLLRLRAPFPVRKLSEAAVRQLVCTTAFAAHPAGVVEVSVIGLDGELPGTRCDG
ncbi:hypothetical protein [Streptomyces sp. CB02261]|uniref:hypothetical protein n=1 Tax=Streptomyces sp. CB02261 TaxID=1703940 RepID=UPI00094061F4|nr:hypothetical protein [Streptomyces sp. CB02261]OKJ69387.1 hypothetical protein AMK29_02865 [Streptomyces sp. CB02261]